MSRVIRAALVVAASCILSGAWGDRRVARLRRGEARPFQEIT